MKYNDCIKKGVKDTAWIDNFCASCLNENSYNERVCTEKMLVALTKYTRSIAYLVARFTARIAEIYINNKAGYAVVIVDVKYGKKVRVYDIKKEVEAEYNRLLEELLNDRHYKKAVAISEILEAYKELYKIEAANYNYIHLNLENNKTNERLINDSVDTISILRKIDSLEEEYGI